jgi:hypothetical protein
LSFYGASFVPRIATLTRCRPGIFFEEANFRWSTLQSHWREWMFSRDGEIMSLADACAYMANQRNACFLRPDADSKLFDGGLFDDDAVLALTTRIGGGERVVVAANRAIDAEWRCFVVNGEVVGSSEYRRNGRPSFYRDAPPRVLEVAAAVIGRWNPAAVYALDLARNGDQIGVLEVNCFPASRFYAADIADVLNAVTVWTRDGSR